MMRSMRSTRSFRDGVGTQIDFLAGGDLTVGAIRETLSHLGARDHAPSAGAGERRADREARRPPIPRGACAGPRALRPAWALVRNASSVIWSDAFDRLEAVIAAETPKRRKS